VLYYTVENNKKYKLMTGVILDTAGGKGWNDKYGWRISPTVNDTA